MKNETNGASRTFVSLDEDAGVVAGYYCLSAGSLQREDAPGAVRRNMPSPIPTVLIGRLAVDQRYRGVGLGASLLQDAALKSIEASRLIGARAILVDALSETAVRFYQRYDFTLMPDSRRALYLLIDDAEKTITSL
ncbi:GNAT family N-acetyltransferase [uncultured Amnibacterium sp.]|uniref:GNAT family N-acetyltransferase n=1 Tax=uncultured Amnibacterium sp. TaxID=1631851 RepID=UPI0035CC1D5A